MIENIGFPVVRTDGRAYGHVITKFSRMGRLPHFLSYGAPLLFFFFRLKSIMFYVVMVVMVDLWSLLCHI